MARQRSILAHERVIDAALKLFAERGIERTSMDAVAEESGVSKATIYKHWTDKDKLLLEVIAHLSGLEERPAFDSGDTRADLIAVLAHQPPGDRAACQQQLIPHLLAYSASHPAFGAAWRAMATDPPRRNLKSILLRGVKNGELAANLNCDLAIALLLGPMMYVKIFRLSSPPLPKQIAKSVVDAFWAAFSLKS